MKRLNLIFKSLPVVFTALLASIFVSCQDDSLLPNGDAEGPEEGLPATVSLKVRIPAMDVQTRALSESEENYVGTIWLGFFNKKTGNCTFNKTFNPPTDQSSATDTQYSLGKAQETDISGTLLTEAEFKDLKAGDLSGQTYIVAVANAEQYMGIDRSATGLVRKTTLSTLLEGVTTWNQFKKITVMRNSTTDVTLTSNTLLMSGYFSPKTLSSTDDNTKHTANDHASYAVGDDIPTVPIYSRPASYELEGAVYLRRVIAYNQFNIYPGSDNITLKVKTWQVNNIPYCSNLVEMDGNACTEIANGVNQGLESHLFSTVTNDDGTEGHSFEFYQLENKHTAVKYEDIDGSDFVGIKPSDNSDEMYACREREYKTANAKNTDALDNTSIYKSLVTTDEYNSEDASARKNNMATYVVLTAELDFWYDKTQGDEQNAIPVAYDATNTNLVHRKAEVTYTIHLGYCEDKDDDGNPTQKTAMDFNCRRNTKYTYNVYINGVNKIVVEAEKEGDEPQPGAEGTVIDMSTDAYDLDAHYCVFNIELTNKQRAALQWYLTVPYGGRTYVYDSSADGVKEFDTESSGYTWIKFRPTSSMNELAKYKDITVEPKLDDSNLRSLDDLKALDDDDATKLKYPWTDGTNTDKGSIDDATPHPYTVFIDEYVYHADPTDPSVSDENQNEWLWGKYVNQENRKVDLYDSNMYPSKDQESYYIPAIYTFSQRSIQTHYADEAQNESAFGAEHINENYGLNFKNDHVVAKTKRVNGEDVPQGQYNGRYNLYVKFYEEKEKLESWDSWVQMTVPDDVPEAKNTVWNYVTIPAKSYPVPMLKPIDTNYTNTEKYPNTDSRNAYSSGGGCLNRNRDLDGNGYIDVKEMRWYVPASEEYIQVAIGQTELPSPLIQFWEHNRDEFSNDTGQKWTANTTNKLEQQYHYWTSDERYFWAEQGMSMGEGQFIDYASHTICYQVRCIRQLGMNPSVDPYTNEKFEYSSSFVDASENGHFYIESKYFTSNSVRPSQSSYLPPHDPSSVTSMPPKKFEVAKDVCRNLTSTDNLFDINAEGFLRAHNNTGTTYTGQDGETKWNTSCKTNSICSLYSQEADGSDKGTWRVPNVRELAMMRTIGLANATDDDTALGDSNDKTGYYLSCTHEYFGYPTWKSGFMYCFYGKRGDDFSISRNLVTEAQNSQEKHIHVKCVRDVISGSDSDVNLGD
jgi:hypothetical protein